VAACAAVIPNDIANNNSRLDEIGVIVFLDKSKIKILLTAAQPLSTLEQD
jgi:hypothetical protein